MTADPTSAADLTDAEARLLQAIDDDATVAALAELVRVPSVTGTDAESDLQDRLGRDLTEAGLDVDAWRLDLDALRADPRFPGTEAERGEGYGLVGVTPGEGPPALVLQGHVDVVPTGDLDRWPDGDPWSARIEGGVLHGRGSCDMKAGVAANLAVVRALAASGVRLRRPLAIHSVVSEEDGGLGAFATMLRGHTGEAAIITEPTSGRVVVANAGALTFELRVAGLAAHASDRLRGRSAVDAFLPVHAALAALEERRNAGASPLFADTPLPYAISIGKLSAGDWASSVPDLLVAEGRLGVRLEETVSEARTALEECLAETSAADPWLRDHPVQVRWTGGQFASGAIEPDHPLIGEAARAVADVTGRAAPRTAAAPYGSDLRLYNGAGIPTLHFGPGDIAFAHAPREQVMLVEVFEAARALALVAARRCGAYFPS